MERSLVDQVKEKAPALALAVVVGLGTLALTAESGGQQNPNDATSHGRMTNETHQPAQTMSYEHLSEPEPLAPVALP